MFENAVRGIKVVVNAGGALLLVLGVSATGCSAGGMDSEALEEFSDTEEVAQIEEGVGEPGCGTMACTAANACSTVSGPNCTGTTEYLSPFPPYGNAALCPQQAVARDLAPGTSGWIRPRFTWQGVTLTAASCPSAVVQVSMYAAYGTGPMQFVGTNTYNGVWAGSFCGFISNDPGIQVAGAPNIREVRVAARARLGASQHRVGVGMYNYCAGGS